MKPCPIDVRVFHEIQNGVTSRGRPAGDDGREVERCFAGFRPADATRLGVRRHRTGRCAVVEQPSHERGIVLLSREVQRGDAIHITRTDERRLGFHQNDGVRGAAFGAMPEAVCHGRVGWHPDWSPEGNKILFSIANDSAEQLQILDLDGSGQAMPLPNQFGRRNSDATWSPDGKQIVFTSDRE